MAIAGVIDARQNRRFDGDENKLPLPEQCYVAWLKVALNLGWAEKITMAKRVPSFERIRFNSFLGRSFCKNRNFPVT
jgi:hypothetical protein